MVLNIGRLISGDDAYVEADIRAVVDAAQGRLVKVIFENAYLDDAQKIRACELSASAGAGFVKTSTGFAASGATIEDLRLMRAAQPGARAGEGRRRCAHARRAPRGDERRRHPDRSHGDRDDPRGLQGPEGRGRSAD